MGKKKVRGHYEAEGYSWEEGEIPKCFCCGKTATRTTPTNGMHICDDNICAAEYCNEECEPIEFIEEEDEE